MIEAKVIKQINFVVVIDYKKHIKVADWFAVNYHNVQLSYWRLLFFDLTKNERRVIKCKR